MTQRTQAQAAERQLWQTDISDEEETIDLLELAEYLWKRILMIAAAVLAGGVVVFVGTIFFVTPKYSSSVMLYVNNSTVSLGNTSVSISGSDLTASRNLVETYLVILTSRETLEEVISEAKVPYTYTQLEDMISAEAVNSTEVFKVTVTSEDPQEASRIANTIVKVLPIRIKTIVDGSNAVCVDSAIPDEVPVSPNVTCNTAIGAIAGLVLSCGFYIIRFLMDIEIHSESYLLKTYPNIPLLTIIPNVNAPVHHYGGYYYGYGYRAAAQKQEEKKGS